MALAKLEIQIWWTGMVWRFAPLEEINFLPARKQPVPTSPEKNHRAVLNEGTASESPEETVIQSLSVPRVHRFSRKIKKQKAEKLGKPGYGKR
jgi:hypothetical protein